MAIVAATAAKEIEAEVKALAGPMAMGAAGAIAPRNFCDLWPKAKPILEIVSGIIVMIPGLGAVAAGVLKGLIKVGDQIAAEVCK